jgi:Fe2+ transport system protein B
VASTMAVLYHGDITTSGMTPLIAFSFMLFVLLYFPCIPTCIGIRMVASVIVTRNENILLIVWNNQILYLPLRRQTSIEHYGNNCN